MVLITVIGIMYFMNARSATLLWVTAIYLNKRRIYGMDIMRIWDMFIEAINIKFIVVIVVQQ